MELEVKDKTDMFASSAEALARRLLTAHGELVTGLTLATLLGYPTVSAFRQSLLRQQVPVPVFTPPGRRGKFALTSDIAAWLCRCRMSALMQRSQRKDPHIPSQG